MQLKYRRKPNSGKLAMMGRTGGHKARMRSMRIYQPGDEIVVNAIEELPGYPHAHDGWELVEVMEGALGTVPQAPFREKPLVDDRCGVGEVPAFAVLRATRHSGNNWKVLVEEPGLNCTAPDGVVLAKGARVHDGFLSKDRAQYWAQFGFDPGETEDAK